MQTHSLWRSGLSSPTLNISLFLEFVYESYLNCRGQSILYRALWNHKQTVFHLWTCCCVQTLRAGLLRPVCPSSTPLSLSIFTDFNCLSIRVQTVECSSGEEGLGTFWLPRKLWEKRYHKYCRPAWYRPRDVRGPRWACGVRGMWDEPEADTEAPEGKILGGHISYMDIWHSAQRAGITFGGFYFVFLKQPGFWLPIWDPEREEKERKTHRKI